MPQLTPDQALREAEDRILESGKTAAPDLNLSNLGLLDLTESLGDLRQLQSLNLRGNKLTILPDCIAQLTRLQTLDLRYNRLTTLPEWLGQLRHLQNLDVSYNQLTKLPDSLGRLSRLQRLDVSSNQLNGLPEALGQLTQLHRLDVSKNKLTALPDSLGKLIQLPTLDLRDNRLTMLPESLGELTALQNLDLRHNQLRTLPKSLGQLTQLQHLHVPNNQLRVLPESLGALTQLQTLDVVNNQLTMLPESFGKLTQLQALYAYDNQLTALPESMRRLTSLKRLYLHRNNSLGIPPEVLGPTWKAVLEAAPPASPASILDYYFRTRRDRRPLNEAKLILVGRGGVGKTCLIKRMLFETFNEHEQETPGIEIQPWEVTLPDGDKVRLHVWDFGGQEILHATHQFFLTERTLYLLVLSGREGKPGHDAEYWLQLIRSFGGDSKVIVALNKSVQHPFDVNRGFLLEKYPAIVDFVKTDCEDGNGVTTLKELILRQTEALEHRKVAFPTDWFAIKERLAGMKENFVTWEKYQEICRDLGEAEAQAQRDLAVYLHILGIALNYRDDPRLKDTHVLNPRWVTEGIYPLLRARQVGERRGVLEAADLGAVLDAQAYPSSKHDFLLRLMERFQLCFKLPGNRERYLVPELLGENQPDIKAVLEAPGLGFQYQYEVLPEGLLPRFIVQTHTYSEANPHWRWRTGVVLNWNDCRAVVRADYRERRVDIHVTGQVEARRRELLAVARAAFEEQHRDLNGLAVGERVPVPDKPGVTVAYRKLLSLEERGINEYEPENMDYPVSVLELLNGMETEDSRKQRRKQERTATLGTRPQINEERKLMRKTVVELDLKGYSDIAPELEEHFSAEVVMKLNEQIQSFVDAGLKAVNVFREETVMADTGDGAIVVFDEPTIGHRFAEAVHQACAVHNQGKTLAAAKRWFRIGIATGDLALETRGGVRKMAGSVISRAVRLEVAANIGEILADADTHASLPAELQACYGAEEQIAGKRHEKFRVRRYVVVRGLSVNAPTANP
jgi:internalin A